MTNPSSSGRPKACEALPKENVSTEVRDRVLAAAKALGYTGPDPAGRRLRLGRAGAIGLIFSERLRYQFTDPTAPAFLAGIAE